MRARVREQLQGVKRKGPGTSLAPRWAFEFEISLDGEREEKTELQTGNKNHRALIARLRQNTLCEFL